MLYRRTEITGQDGVSVYGRLIAKQQPSLLAWTQMLDLSLGGNCVIAQNQHLVS